MCKGVTPCSVLGMIVVMMENHLCYTILYIETNGPYPTVQLWALFFLFTVRLRITILTILQGLYFLVPPSPPSLPSPFDPESVVVFIFGLETRTLFGFRVALLHLVWSQFCHDSDASGHGTCTITVCLLIFMLLCVPFVSPSFMATPWLSYLW